MKLLVESLQALTREAPSHHLHSHTVCRDKSICYTLITHCFSEVLKKLQGLKEMSISGGNDEIS